MGPLRLDSLIGKTIQNDVFVVPFARPTSEGNAMICEERE